MLQAKKILIGVTGSIAAYKIPLLIRLLVKSGAVVRVIMTPGACDFVTPLTLSTVSQNPVNIKPFNTTDGSWNSHIDLGNWADAFVIAPLTANTMAKMAIGLCDNLLTAVYLAARCPVFFAPAMDVDMYNHPVTQANIQKLVSVGNILINPAEGELASGLTGYGRMEEPENILKILDGYFSKKKALAGKKILITAGPTIEPIDPVRFISNFSSGKMGFSLALEAAERGGEVTLVTGPVNLEINQSKIKVIPVKTAREMFIVCTNKFAESNITIMSAAVADYTPGEPQTHKIKKEGEDLYIKLVKTRDILASLGAVKKEGQVLAGFALETDDEIMHAKQKLHTKKLDFIVLNSLKDKNSGFGTDTNKITIINAEEVETVFDLKSKQDVASDILDYLEQNYLNSKQ